MSRQIGHEEAINAGGPGDSGAFFMNDIRPVPLPDGKLREKKNG